MLHNASIPAWCTPRAILRCTPQRNDLFVPKNGAMALPPTARIVTVDPGFCRPIQVAASPLAFGSNEDNTTLLQCAQGANRWHVSKEEWMRNSGRAERDAYEAKRRRLVVEYDNALNAMNKLRRRTAEAGRFTSYIQVSLLHLGARLREHASMKRANFNWHAWKVSVQHFDRMCNRMFGLQSVQKARTEKRGEAWSHIEKKQIRDGLHSERRKKTIVFFDDGLFSCTMRGTPAIPKKHIIQFLSRRGLTCLLCERNTSKRCPCGMSDLVDGPNHDAGGGARVRVHRTDGGLCSFLTHCNDRDEVAACGNMQLAAHRCIRGQSWPAHLI